MRLNKQLNQKKVVYNQRTPCYIDPFCVNCKYRGSAGGWLMCCYWEIEDKLRPCKPGKDCRFSPMNGGDTQDRKRQRWDYDRLHELYISGMRPSDICEQEKVPKATLAGYAARYNWADEREKLHPGIGAKLHAHCIPQWDVELGKELYYAGYKRTEISDICGVKYNALCFYIDNHGWAAERRIYMAEKNEIAGVKDKTGKPPLGMTFALRKAVNAIAYVREYGLKKYRNADNWKRVPMQDWADAAERHLTAWQSGEKVDPESGMSHLWHALTNLAYMAELEE